MYDRDKETRENEKLVTAKGFNPFVLGTFSNNGLLHFITVPPRPPG